MNRQFRDGNVVPSVTVVLDQKKRLLSISREGHFLPLRGRSPSEAPNPFSGEGLFWLNDVSIGICGHRSSSMAGLG